MNESDLTDLTTGHLNKKPHLSDAIHFPTDIAPHPFVCIWADVGSGKNSFIEKMIAGCPEESIPRLTVLLITSRKAKVIETLNKYTTCSILTRIAAEYAMKIFSFVLFPPTPLRTKIETDFS